MEDSLTGLSERETTHEAVAARRGYGSEIAPMQLVVALVLAVGGSVAAWIVLAVVVYGVVF